MRPRTALMIVGYLAAAVLPASAEEFTQSYTLDAELLRVGNLIGEVTLEGTTGSQFEITIHVQGNDASRDVITFDVDDRGPEAAVIVQFPIHEEQDFIYPHMGRGSKTTMNWGKNHGDRDDFWGQLWKELRGKKVTVRRDGRGVEMWADVTIKVPAGAEVSLRHGVGAITAADIKGDLDLDTHTGRILVDDVDGNLVADTGSGSVKVGNISGNVNLDTGSGGVEVSGVVGNLLVDTGSGSVEVNGAEGAEINIDTGSGSVRVTGAVCRELRIDTGSGSVRANSIEASDVSIDTGSGGVDLELVKMGVGEIDIDTGSGGIDLVLPPDASVTVDAETGSGRISLVVDGEDYSPRKRRQELSFTIGDGDTEVSLETGSGSINIRSE